MGAETPLRGVRVPLMIPAPYAEEMLQRSPLQGSELLRAGVRWATVVLPKGGVFEPEEDAPAVRIVPGNLPGTIRAVPLFRFTEGRAGPPVMASGIYLASSDGRIGDEALAVLRSTVPPEDRLVFRYFSGAIPLHDRVEEGFVPPLVGS